MGELVGQLIAALSGSLLPIHANEDKHWAEQQIVFDDGRVVETSAQIFGDPGSGRPFPTAVAGLGLSKGQLAVFPFEASPMLLRRTLVLDGFSVDVLRDRTKADPGWGVRGWRIAECAAEGRPLLLHAPAGFLRLLRYAVTAEQFDRD